MARCPGLITVLACIIGAGTGFAGGNQGFAAEVEVPPSTDGEHTSAHQGSHSSTRNGHAAPTMRIVSSDERRSTRFMWLGINKETVIELSRDIKEILIGGKGANGSSGAASSGTNANSAVGNGSLGVVGGGTSQPTETEIVKVVPLSKRRISLLGVSRGHTSVFFYDNQGSEIGALDIAVTTWSRTPAFDLSGTPVDAMRIIAFRNGSFQPDYITCTRSDCRRLPESRDDTDTALQLSRGSYGNSTIIYNSR